MSIGWMTDVAEATALVYAERLEQAAWDAVNDHVKEKALANSYIRLYYDPRFSLPEPALATAAELIVLKKAQYEMAYYLLLHLADEDRRKGLQAQGVVKAGIVKEDYDREWLERLPVPPLVLSLLDPWLEDQHVILPSDIERDEDQSAKKKVHRF